MPDDERTFLTSTPAAHDFHCAGTRSAAGVSHRAPARADHCAARVLEKHSNH
jgi:hypothetical protein